MTDRELNRLKTLRLYRVMDTAAEKTLDDLTRLAAMICEAPISLISLVDDRRQWFKSRHGIDAQETPRDQAFCAHAIQSSELMVVEDAEADERFVKNPLVTGEPGIRFYAGAPLEVRPGLRLGTLCVIDRTPRKLSEFQREALRILSSAVVAQLDLTRAEIDFKAIESFLPVCSWCRAVEQEDKTWIALDDYIKTVASEKQQVCPLCCDETERALFID